MTPTLKAALVQVNVAVGALTPNAQKIARLAREAAGAGAQLIVFPELALCGYPPEDLVLKRHFLADCSAALRSLAQALPPEPIVLVGAPVREGRNTFNALAVFQGRRLRGFHHKQLRSDYGAFDESRVFAAGAGATVVDAGGLRIGLHICEDSLDAAAAPCAAIRDLCVDVLVNISASPYYRGRHEQREKLLSKAARFAGAPLLNANLVGGQDELVFEGASVAFNARGKLIARARQFAEEILFVEVPIVGKKRARISNRWKPAAIKVPTIGKPAEKSSNDWKNRRAPALGDLEEVYSALKLGLRDYVDKNGFPKVALGLSGGVDSALVAAICVDALGPDRVVGVTMPSKFSSAETRSDAVRLAKNLRIPVHTVAIQRLYEGYLAELAPLWPGRASDTTEENIQARIRGNIVMALSNKFGWLVVTTGNKSEAAVGYCTLYGDMAGGFALIKDVPKTLVWALARWRNAAGEVIPATTIERAPTAELHTGQKDQDTLPPYDVLDGIIERYVEMDWSLDAMVADGFDAATVKRVIRMIDRSEYKRRQSAPGVKITPRAFGPERRLPITNLYGERI